MQKVVLALAVVAVALVAVSRADEKYTTKYDNIDLEQILKNDRLLNKYYECLMADTDAGCTADGKELKKNIPDALTNKCSKCSPQQRNGAERVIRFLIQQKPTMWKAVEAKYDPTGIYHKQYESEYKKVAGTAA